MKVHSQNVSRTSPLVHKRSNSVIVPYSFCTTKKYFSSHPLLILNFSIYPWIYPKSSATVKDFYLYLQSPFSRKWVAWLSPSFAFFCCHFESRQLCLKQGNKNDTGIYHMCMYSFMCIKLSCKHLDDHQEMVAICCYLCSPVLVVLSLGVMSVNRNAIHLTTAMKTVTSAVLPTGGM